MLKKMKLKKGDINRNCTDCGREYNFLTQGFTIKKSGKQICGWCVDEKKLWREVE